jgi:hypothetical protein
MRREATVRFSRTNNNYFPVQIQESKGYIFQAVLFDTLSKRNLMLSILFVRVIAVAGTAYYLYRPNSARLLAF